MRAGEYCIREVVVVQKTESPLEAARIMRDYQVGDVIIVEERQGQKVPIGILTDRDITLQIVAGERAPGALSVIDIMQQTLITVQEEDSLDDCLTLMKQHAIRRVPVINSSGALVGVLALDDLIEIVSEQLIDLVKLVRFQSEKRQGNLK